MRFLIKNQEQAYEALCRVHQEIERAILEKQTLCIEVSPSGASETQDQMILPFKPAEACTDYGYMD